MDTATYYFGCNKHITVDTANMYWLYGKLKQTKKNNSYFEFGFTCNKPRFTGGSLVSFLQ